MTETTTICRCGKPTRTGFVLCEPCGEELARALGDIPWLEEELETTMTGQRGVDYRAMGGPKGTERPSPVPWKPSEVRAHLRGLLVSWTRFCAEEGVRHQERTDELPADTLTAMSRWLLSRVDGLMLHEIGPDAVDEITSAVAHCYRIIDKPAERQYLGNCSNCESGRLYARPGAKYAICEECGVAVEAGALKDGLLEQLNDRLCTAAEIAHLSTYLGLKADREQVRKRINTWSARGLIEEHKGFDGTVMFAFGNVYARLMVAEHGITKAAS